MGWRGEVGDDEEAWMLDRRFDGLLWETAAGFVVPSWSYSLPRPGEVETRLYCSFTMVNILLLLYLGQL